MDHLETLPEFHSHPSADGNMVEYGGREPEESAKGRKSMGLSRFMEKIRFKKREEEDKELPPVPWKELLKLNLPDWYLVIPGVLSAGAIGALFPVLAVVFSGALEVRACICVCVCVLLPKWCFRLVYHITDLHLSAVNIFPTELWQHQS